MASRKTKKKDVRVVSTSPTGRNLQFDDGGKRMSSEEFVRRIQNGEYGGYHVRIINGVRTACSNPDNSEGNNLG